MGTETELAVLFSDVVGSTRIYELLGDQCARQMVATCVGLMRKATKQYRGNVVKTMGDEVMATFVSADDALNAAAQMQRLVAAHPELQVEGQPIALRIGCHFGPVMLETRDVFGSTVHTANRMTSQAKAGQIVITASTAQHLPEEWRSSVRQIDVATMKGQSSEVTLCEVLWQTEGVTSMVQSIALSGTYERPVGRLRLVVGHRQILVDDLHPQLSIGRADENDVVLRGNLVSRIHARIEVSRHRFLLVDQSTNGTFVHPDGVEPSFVRRDSVELKGSGMIGLGALPEADALQTIHFACEDA
jgi:class 3 adenylate cyclase